MTQERTTIKLILTDGSFRFVEIYKRNLKRAFKNYPLLADVVAVEKVSNV